MEPTAIQEKVIPVATETVQNIIGLAQTGTGKTAAFGLPIIQQIDIGNTKTQALILAPTRELCMQIAKDLQNFSKYIDGLRVVSVYGGANIDAQIRSLKKGAHIITATPGRMLDIINRKAANISKIRTVVLDEADEMLNMGFRDDLDDILKNTPKSKRTFLFSATMPKDLERIAKNYIHDPFQITIGQQNAVAENVRHTYYQVNTRDRYLALRRIIDYNPGLYGIVFCRTRAETKDVADKLIKDGYNADALHGDLSQAQRDNVMNRFRQRALQVLVATDVAARGIDVNDITHILNYNLPDDTEIYTHRSGRTGRAGRSGDSVVFVNNNEKKRISHVEKIIRKKVEKLNIPSGQEIFEKQLQQFINRVENVKIEQKKIEPFLEMINEKLAHLSKEEIIKHFVSLEVNRYGENLNDKDLNKPDFKTDKIIRSEKFKSKVRNKNEEGFTRFFINIGKKDGAFPQNILGIINENARVRNIEIGNIDTYDTFSFFNADSKHADDIINGLSNVKHKGRGLIVELANEKGQEKIKGKGAKHKRKKSKKRTSG